LQKITLKTQIKTTYTQLTSLLAKNNCKTISADPPFQIKVIQGSLSGISPKKAKKTIIYTLISNSEFETQVSAASKISSDWANLTLYGSILAATLSAIFLWIASDVENYVLDFKAGFWSWLSKAYGYPDIQTSLFMIGVTRALAVFLIAAIALEIAIVIYVYPRRNGFADQTLAELKKKSNDTNTQK
jgi:hypothetical protein